MKTSTYNNKIKISYRDAIVSLGLIFILAVFCKVTELSLIIPFLLLFFGLHLAFLGKSSVRLFLNLGLLLTVVVSGTSILQNYTTHCPLYLPVAGIAMLTMILFDDLHLVFIMSFLSSAFVGLLLSQSRWLVTLGVSPLDVTLIFLIGSLAGAYAVRDARTRGTLIAAGFYVGVIQAVGMILIHHNLSLLFSPDFLKTFILPPFMSGIFCILVLSTLKIFEYLFGVITNFSLLELSDFNQPLLKRMILEAPGTYHHSLVVSNIAEAAADAIGANALLTRVGAYYHDIGKLDQPEYFTENQIAMGNKHDDLEPSMSRLVVLNHVKEGMEMAKKYRLNPIIANFIPEHHGTSLMHFFYQKALAEAADQGEVKEENYRYPGPKPQRKETAIVLLADSAEAASRSLEELTPNRIEEVVRKVINNKFIDGQLDESNLTLKEIETISVTFTRSLSATYHGRVKYPELKNASDYRNTKSADENSNQPRRNQDGNS